MVRYRTVARAADVVHFQWLAVQAVDRYLLPDRPTVLTAHDLLPREPRPGQVRAQRRLYDAVDAVVVHSGYGRDLLVQRLGVDPAKVRVIHHGAFKHLTAQPHEARCPTSWEPSRRRSCCSSACCGPTRALDTLLERLAGRRRRRAVGGGPPAHAARAAAGGGRRARASGSIPRFVSDDELPAFFRRADIVVLPYSRTERLDWSGVLATALAFGKPIVVSDVGGFGEVAAAGAARLVAPDDPGCLRAAILRAPDRSSRRVRASPGARGERPRGPTRGRRRHTRRWPCIATWFHSPP